MTPGADAAPAQQAPPALIEQDEIDRLRRRIASDDLGFLTERDLEPLARLIGPVRSQLAQAAAELDLPSELLRGMRP